MDLSLVQWIVGGCAAALVGVSKTGMPGAGILVVPLLALIFTGSQAPGAMLPMLIFGDLFAVAWYRRHTRWDKLWGLIPWVLIGMAGGALLLDVLARTNSKQLLNQVIGVIVLVMLGIHVLRMRMGERMAPHSRLGVLATGSAAGFTTTASNAAGPIMTIYLQGMGMKKEQFMGTNAWFFFLVNVSKIPIFLAISLIHPTNPILSHRTIFFDVAMVPFILLGVFSGKWLFHRIPQKLFDDTVLILAAVSSLYLVVR